MAITIKSEEHIEKMRVAGQILKRLDEILRDEIKPGITTAHLDKIAEVKKFKYLTEEQNDSI